MGFLTNLVKPKLMFQVLHPRVSHSHHLTLGTPPFGDAPPPRTVTAAHSRTPAQKKAKKPTDEPTETNTDQPEKEKVTELVKEPSETVAVVAEKEAAVVKEEEVAVVIDPKVAAATQAEMDAAAAKVQAISRGQKTRAAAQEKAAAVKEGAAAAEKVAEKVVEEKAVVEEAVVEKAVVEEAVVEKAVVEEAVVEKAVVEQAVVERAAEEKEAKTPVAKTPVAAAPPPRNLLSPVVGWVSGIFAPQSIPASTPAAAQKVQAAEFSTMVSHQVPCFVEAGEEEEAGTEAEVALPGFLSLPPVRRPTLVDSVVGWVSGVFTAKCATQPTHPQRTVALSPHPRLLPSPSPPLSLPSPNPLAHFSRLTLADDVAGRSFPPPSSSRPSPPRPSSRRRCSCPTSIAPSLSAIRRRLRRR